MIPTIKQKIIGLFVTYKGEVYHIIDTIDDGVKEILYLISDKGFAIGNDEGIFLSIHDHNNLSQAVESVLNWFTRIYTTQQLECLKAMQIIYKWTKYPFKDEDLVKCRINN